MKMAHLKTDLLVFISKIISYHLVAGRSSVTGGQLESEGKQLLFPITCPSLAERLKELRGPDEGVGVMEDSFPNDFIMKLP